LEYKQVAVSNTWDKYRCICSLFFDEVTISVEALNHSGRSMSQSLGGKMIHPADIAIA
jgi:hypothetical protein